MSATSSRSATVKPPRGETLWVSVWNEDYTKLFQIITSNALRTKYYLYNVGDGDKLTKIETNDTPVFDKIKF